MMRKVASLVVALTVVLAFTAAAVVVAAEPVGGEFYVVKDAAGKVAVVDKKPADAKSIVSGPFKTKEAAENALKAAPSEKKPVKLPDQGC